MAPGKKIESTAQVTVSLSEFLALRDENTYLKAENKALKEQIARLSQPNAKAVVPPSRNKNVL